MSDAIRKIRIPSEQWDEQGVTLYNLDVVIAVGYRVNSYDATQFRIWATKVLKEYDFDKNSETTLLFYKTVQNMMHYAVTCQTAAEIVYDRANAEKPYMGLTTWKNAPDGRKNTE